jgi:CheY-like chemotaxis protein
MSGSAGAIAAGSCAMDCGVHPIVRAPYPRDHRRVANRILIVDDSPGFRDMAAGLLAERGFDVLATVGDGEQALAAVGQACPDGILLDINLPGRDGFDVAVSLAAVCPDARIVLTSASYAHLPDGLLRDCAAAGFVAKEDLTNADFVKLFTRPAGT